MKKRTQIQITSACPLANEIQKSWQRGAEYSCENSLSGKQNWSLTVNFFGGGACGHVRPS